MSIWVMIYRFSWTLLALLVLVVLATVFYSPLRQYRELQQKQSRMEEESRFEEELLQHLKMKQERLLNDPRFVEKIAREEMGYAKPGETVFKFVDDEPTNSRPSP